MAEGDFGARIRKRAKQITTRQQALFAAVATAAFNSIVFGSATTGAPGQPVDTGALRASWRLTFVGKNVALISTNLPYAAMIEDGIFRPGRGKVTANTSQRLVLRSPVGGFFSVRLTVLGIDRIVQEERANLRRGG